MARLMESLPICIHRLFAAYGGMEESVQQTIQQLVTPLVRALGQNHQKLLTLLRTFPPGAETLALRVLNIWTENGRPSHSIVNLVKTLVNERDLDARFLIPIIAEMDKVRIMSAFIHSAYSFILNRPTSSNTCLAYCRCSMEPKKPSLRFALSSTQSSRSHRNPSEASHPIYHVCGRASF